MQHLASTASFLTQSHVLSFSCFFAPKPYIPTKPTQQVVKREVLERSTAELAAARAASDDARYELARHLNTVSEDL